MNEHSHLGTAFLFPQMPTTTKANSTTSDLFNVNFMTLFRYPKDLKTNIF